MAPIISMACFSRIRRAMDAPIGPTPYWMARIFFFTSFSAVRLYAHNAHFRCKRNPTIMEFPRAFNEEAFQAFERPVVRARRGRNCCRSWACTA